MASQLYPHGIQSIRGVHPELPNIFCGFDLNAAINEGDPINLDLLTCAQELIQVFKGIQGAGINPLITAAVVHTTELRAHMIKAAHASALFMPVNSVNVLQDINHRLENLRDNLNEGMNNIDQRLHNIDQKLFTVSANIQNVQIITRNGRQKPPNESYHPLQKTIAGDGQQLVQEVAQSHAAAIEVTSISNLNFQIGAIPEPFIRTVRNYDDVSILRLIRFYNETFGIVQGDGIDVRQDKLRAFLTQL